MTVTSVDLLTLPTSVLKRRPQSAVADMLTYFTPDLVVIPGARSPEAAATVRQAAPDCPVVHPQLGQATDGIVHHRFGATTDTEVAPVDVLAVQSPAVLGPLQTQLETGDRVTGAEATFVILPELAVEYDTASLSATLPAATAIADVATTLDEPVTVLAGGQPVEYTHEWHLTAAESTVSVPVAGLGATTEEAPQLAGCTCTASGRVAAEAVTPDAFGLQALTGIGPTTAQRLHERGYRSIDALHACSVEELTTIPGVGRQTATDIQAHAEVLASGEPLVLTNKTLVKSKTGQPPLCLDIETDGLSPTIIWQIGVYDPVTDTHQAFVETDTPTDPQPLLEAFITWLLATHGDRTLLSWNGFRFDYPLIRQFLTRHCPAYVEAWDDLWTYDLYDWAVQQENAFLPGRTNKLEHVARALGYERADTGLTGAQTAAAYQTFMSAPDDPAAEPNWERHKQYCEDDCRALWHVYQAISEAPRRAPAQNTNTTEQAGLTDFYS